MELTDTSPSPGLDEPDRPAFAAGTAAMRRLARQLRAAGQVAEARSIYRRLEDASPDDPAILFESAQIHQLAGEKALAVELLHRCVALKPESAEYHNAFGAILCDLGRPVEALEVLEGALSIDPVLADAHCNRGIALNMAGHGDEAMPCWRRAIELRPTDAMAHFCIGEALLHDGDVNGAVEYLREAIRLNPKLVGAYLCLTTALQRLGRVEEALPLGREALILRPVWSICHTNLGALLHMQGRVDEAIESYARAIELDPTDPRPRRNRAYSYLKKGDFELGWAEHEWRHFADGGVSPNDGMAHPLWNDCSIKGWTGSVENL